MFKGLLQFILGVAESGQFSSISHPVPLLLTFRPVSLSPLKTKAN